MATRYDRGSWEMPSQSVAHVSLAPPAMEFEEMMDLETAPLRSCRACVRRSKLLEGLKNLLPMPGLRRGGPQPVGELDLGDGQVQPGCLQPTPVVVEHHPEPEGEILDLPLPQRAPRARGRPSGS